MEVSLLSGGTKHSLETVRVLHETVLALRTALECSRKELSELRRRSRSRSKDEVTDPASMDESHESERKGEESFPDGKPDSGAESEDIDDIELVFTTGESDPGAMHEDMVPICDERKPQTHTVLVETDISKCGIIDENDDTLGRRNTLPDPLPYRPIVHREILAAARAPRGSPLKIRPVPSSARQETGAQTDITAVPALWKSETYLAHKNSYNLTTLPSKFTLPVPRASHIPLSDKSREARRVLLSDINFTSMVPELSRSADHLHQDEDLLHRHHPGEYMKSMESGWESRTPGAGKHDSKSSWESRFQASQTSISGNEVHTGHSCRALVPCRHSHHSCSSIPSFRCHPVHHIVRHGDPCVRRIKNKVAEHHCYPAGLSLPDLRTDCDSGESTDSLIDEAEEFLRRSIDNMLPKMNPKKADRRYSEPDSASDFVPPNSAQPFLPKTPNDLKRNYLVKVINGDGRIVMGRVRFSGQVTGSQEPYVGIELQSNSGGTDGTFLDHRYFDCKPDHAIFVPFKKVVLAWCT